MCSNRGCGFEGRVSRPHNGPVLWFQQVTEVSVAGVLITPVPQMLSEHADGFGYFSYCKLTTSTLDQHQLLYKYI